MAQLEEIKAAAAAGTTIQAWSIIWPSMFPSCLQRDDGKRCWCSLRDVGIALRGVAIIAYRDVGNSLQRDVGVA